MHPYSKSSEVSCSLVPVNAEWSIKLENYGGDGNDFHFDLSHMKSYCLITEDFKYISHIRWTNFMCFCCCFPLVTNFSLCFPQTKQHHTGLEPHENYIGTKLSFTFMLVFFFFYLKPEGRVMFLLFLYENILNSHTWSELKFKQFHLNNTFYFLVCIRCLLLA